MISVSDVLKVLESIPTWKQIKDLPARVDALEKRLAEFENRLKKGVDSLCPKCGEPSFELIESKPHPVMKDIGIIERTYTCSGCGFTEKKTYDS